MISLQSLLINSLGQQVRTGAEVEGQYNPVRRKSVFPHGRRAGHRVLFHGRRSEEGHHGPRQVQEDPVRILLRRVLREGRCRECNKVSESVEFCSPVKLGFCLFCGFTRHDMRCLLAIFMKIISIN